MTTLRQSLAEAWGRRANVAEADLTAASTAPALFKPEYVAERQADRDHAVQQLKAALR